MTSTSAAVVSVQHAVVQGGGEEALGSRREDYPGFKPVSDINLSVVSGLVWLGAQDHSVSQVRKCERSDSERVYPYCITLGMARWRRVLHILDIPGIG